ncbi:TetR/AcrR family transcriptional regulator [Metabacillus sediminilitoris]|uniref:TetR/AcrR family transcriptional regulator n=1 Tax=Metabacillus sediminilitoris TaxID=2567941 RepID=A0A4V3WG07_9BACI|nr:TetR/AcrR family transcriptional regulator [Metabacillus sediminilitoris]QGQ45345.1 TetR family transcriptional regulator [Metabacillus sediminilitoris]THF82357.1 TetR/AcrR family transcriptional regulator [Metabacillus sediminilitoris]
MPKITFFNLPEDKKQKLIAAAKQEYSRVPLYEASITNIIKKAGIPRGSFYQYFEDKEDAFFFLLKELTKEYKKNFLLLLKNNNGDLFDTMASFFELIIKEEDNIHFLRNTFLNMTFKIERTFASSFSEIEMNENFQRMSNLINKSTLNVANDKELFHLMQIISSVTFRNFVKIFAQEVTLEEAMNDYMIEMNLLKNGLFRNNGESTSNTK